MVPGIMQAVTGKKLIFSEATLKGYGRYRLRGRVYPGIIKSAHGSVRGLIWHGVDRRSLELLDAFEAEEYRRIPVTVRGNDGKRYSAYTYVIRPRYAKLLTREDWDLEEFRKIHLKQYLQRLASNV